MPVRSGISELNYWFHRAHLQPTLRGFKDLPRAVECLMSDEAAFGGRETNSRYYRRGSYHESIFNLPFLLK